MKIHRFYGGSPPIYTPGQGGPPTPPDSGSGSSSSWPVEWGTAFPNPDGFLLGLGQAFNGEPNSNWYPIRDWEALLNGRKAQIVKVWPSEPTSAVGGWDHIAGGASDDVKVYDGFLGSSYGYNVNRAFNPSFWPIDKPIVVAMYIVPNLPGVSNHYNKNTNQFSNPNIWNQIKNGNYDTYYLKAFKRLANICKDRGRDPRTVILRIAWEMNGEWYPHAIGPDISNFILAWRRLVDMMKTEQVKIAGKHNMVEFGVTKHLRCGVSTAAQFNRIDNPRPKDYYPGDSYVDICGMGIHDGVGISTEAQWKAMETFPYQIGAGNYYEGIRDWFNFAVSRGKLIGSSEFELNYIDRTAQGLPKTTNPTVCFQGWHDLLKSYSNNAVYSIYLWGSTGGFKSDTTFGARYISLYKKV